MDTQNKKPTYNELQEKIVQLETRLQIYETSNFQYQKEILDTISEPTSLVDKNYRYVYVNKAYENCIGHKGMHIIGRNVEELVGHENFHKTVKPNFDKCLQGKKISYKNVLSLPDKPKDLHLLMNYYPHYNSDGGIDGVISTAKDITNEILKKKEWEKTINSVDDILLIVSKDFEIEDINSNGLQLLGKKREEVLGKKCYKAFHNVDNPKDFCPMFKSRKTKKTETITRFEKKFNKHFQIKSSPIFNNKGVIIKYVDLMHDITNLKNVENRLREKNDEYNAVNEELREKNEEYIQLNQKLSNLNERYALINKYSSDAIAMYDSSYKPLYMSPSSINLSGYNADEFKEKNIFDIVHPEDRNQLIKKIKDANEKGLKSYTLQYRIKRKNGNYIWIESASHVVDDKNSNRKYVIVNSRNVNERKKTELALAENKKIKDLILSATNELVAYYDKNLQIVWTNKTSATSLNKTPKQMIGQYCYNIWHGRDEPCENCPVLKARDSKTPQTAEQQTPDGRYWKLRGYPILNEKQEIVALIEFGQDITDRKMLELELKKENERLGSILSNINIGLIVHNPDRTVYWVNKHIRELFPHGNPVEKICYEFFENRSTPCKQCAVRTCFKTGIASTIESHNKANNRWFLSAAQPLKRQNAEVVQVIEAVLEITELKKTETELIEAKEKAEESNRLKTEFLNSISHEFRTPMNGIVGFSQLIVQQNTSPEKRKKYAQLITDSCNQLIEILTDTVEISQVQSQSIQIKKSKTNIHELLQNAMKNIEQRAKTKNIQTRLLNECTKHFSYIETDEHKLYRLIKHLLDNAVKFTHKGFIELHCRKNDCRELQISVQDTGIGIPPEKHQVIFEPFRQVESGLTRRYGGSGIGLSLAKAYVEILGGKIRIESGLNKGTTVSFSLPDTSIPEYHQKQQDITFNIPDWSGKTALIVEDEKNNYLYLSELFIETKANTIHAKNGKEAVAITRANLSIDLILMDIKMPVMDGYEATRRIRKFRPQIPIIALTAYGYEKSNEKLSKTGFDDIIVKPISINNLTRIIDKHIG